MMTGRTREFRVLVEWRCNERINPLAEPKVVSVTMQPGHAVTMLFDDGTYLVFWLRSPTVQLSPSCSYVFPPQEVQDLEGFIIEWGRYGRELVAATSQLVVQSELTAA